MRDNPTVVDANLLCEELEQLCCTLTLFNDGRYPGGDVDARRSVRCLFHVLGDDPALIVSSSLLTADCLAALSEELRVIWAGEYLRPGSKCAMPTSEQVETLQRHLVAIRDSAKTTSKNDVERLEQNNTSTKAISPSDDAAMLAMHKLVENCPARLSRVQNGCSIPNISAIARRVAGQKCAAGRAAEILRVEYTRFRNERGL
jgi:hypothetical protein